MRNKILVTILIVTLPMLTIAMAQGPKRQDVIWARSTAGAAITLDGRLNETVWAQAESMRVQYGIDSGIPGSGWRNENPNNASDPTDAILKFLVVDNQLYLGVTVKDSSIGGGAFNKFDGILMNLRNKANPARPAPPFEYFYAWWDNDPNTLVKGAPPSFFGPVGGPRDPDKAAIWDAATSVDGIANSDTGLDRSYTMEFKLNLTPRGYDVTRPQGDILSFNISIYDADWQWPLIPSKFSGNRVWWQGPFSAPLLNTVRIYARPDVNVNSGAVPDVPPELIIPNGQNFANPVIDGQLTEAVWQKAPSFDLKFGDDALRATYPGIGPIASGQFQPAIGNPPITASVLDPADATFKYFFKQDTLYLGVDVRDLAVGSLPNEEQWDGIRFMITDRAERHPDDHNLVGRELVVRFDATGNVIAEGYLANLIAANGAKVGVSMKPGTTIDNFNDEDAGYFIELAVDLTKLGYPPGRGDGLAFLGATLFDGDSFANPADNYGNRVWWFKERGGNSSPVWAYMDPNALITSVAENPTSQLPEKFALLGSYPNPFNPSTTIQFTMPEPGAVTLKVYDVMGRNVRTIALGQQPAGKRETVFTPDNLSSGVYFYRLEMTATTGNKTHSTLYGKMMFVK